MICYMRYTMIINHIQLSAAKGLVQFKDQDVTRALLLSLGISEEMDFCRDSSNVCQAAGFSNCRQVSR